jgi:hypothetical protein
MTGSLMAGLYGLLSGSGLIAGAAPWADRRGDCSNQILETLEQWNRVLEETSLRRNGSLERNLEEARKPDV